MTFNRMGNTRRTGKGSFGGPRAWITGAIAVGVVATSGAVASAALHEAPDADDLAAGSEECLNLNEQTMKAIFQAWMEQGGGFKAGTLHPQSAPSTQRYVAKSDSTKAKKVTPETSEDDEESAGGRGNGTVQRPDSFTNGRNAAKVPLSKLSLGACDDGGTPLPDPTTAPTDVPIDPPTTEPAPPAETTGPPTTEPAPPAETTKPPTTEPPAPTVTSTAS